MDAIHAVRALVFRVGETAQKRPREIIGKDGRRRCFLTLIRGVWRLPRIIEAAAAQVVTGDSAVEILLGDAIRPRPRSRPRARSRAAAAAAACHHVLVLSGSRVTRVAARQESGGVRADHFFEFLLL